MLVVLKSRYRRGLISSAGQVYDREHEHIIDPRVFAKAGELLASGLREPARERNVRGFLLRGLFAAPSASRSCPP